MRRRRPRLAHWVLAIGMMAMPTRPGMAITPLSPPLAYAKGALAAQSLVVEYVEANRATQALMPEQTAFWQSARGRSLLAAVTFLHHAAPGLGLPLQRLDEAWRFAAAQRVALAKQKAGKAFLTKLTAAENQFPIPSPKAWPTEDGMAKFLEENVAAMPLPSWACPAAPSHDRAEVYACQLRSAWESGDGARMLATLNDPTLRTIVAEQTAAALLVALNSLSVEKDTDALGILFDLQERQDAYGTFYDVAQRIQAARQRGQSEVILK